MVNFDKTPYETLNIKLCKHTLKLPRRVSNLSVRAELGRLPMRHSIIVALIQYYSRSKTLNEHDLLSHAFSSQENIRNHSYKTLSYSEACHILSSDLDLKDINVLPDININNHLKCHGLLIKEASIKRFKSLFQNRTNMIRENDSKLALYCSLKKHFVYEKYLDVGCQHLTEFTKFRMSNHWLPIERGRYTKPKTPREERFCYFCKNNIGTEYHVLMECDDILMKELRLRFTAKIFKLHPLMEEWPSRSIFQYAMMGIESNFTRLMADWITQCNKLNKDKCRPTIAI